MAGTGLQPRTLLHFLFPVLQVLLFSFCLLIVPAMYSSDTRGSLPAEQGGERLEKTIKEAGEGQGAAWPVLEESLFP